MKTIVFQLVSEVTSQNRCGHVCRLKWTTISRPYPRRASLTECRLEDPVRHVHQGLPPMCVLFCRVVPEEVKHRFVTDRDVRGTKQ